jgi:hypothetical protein
MRRTAICALALALAACATPAPFIAPVAVGKPPSEVSRFLPASEAKLFPCSIFAVSGLDFGGSLRSEVSVAPGRYHVTLSCSSGYHVFKPDVQFTARAGKAYRLTGYLIDDSITIFTMKMNVKVEELP